MTAIRLCYALTALALIALGLLTRVVQTAPYTPFVKYSGSMLWGAMVYCVMRALLPHYGRTLMAVAAFCLAALVEVSQLCHVPWLDAFRATRLGTLLLGRVFSWGDMAAYGGGIAIFYLIDTGVRALFKSSK